MALIQRGRVVVRGLDRKHHAGAREALGTSRDDLPHRLVRDAAARASGATQREISSTALSASGAVALTIATGRPFRVRTRFRGTLLRRARQRASVSPAPVQFAKADPKASGASASAARRSSRHVRHSSGPSSSVSVAAEHVRHRYPCVRCSAQSPTSLPVPTMNLPSLASAQPELSGARRSAGGRRRRRGPRYG